MYRFVFSINEREMLNIHIRNSWDERSMSVLDTQATAELDKMSTNADTVAKQAGDSYAMLAYRTLAYTIGNSPIGGDDLLGYNGALAKGEYWHTASDSGTNVNLFIGNLTSSCEYDEAAPAIFAECCVAWKWDAFLYTPDIDEASN